MALGKVQDTDVIWIENHQGDFQPGCCAQGGVLATSLSTVYAAWEINHAATTGNGLFLNEKSAELMLHIIEPIQIAYGAAVCAESIRVPKMH